MAASPKAPTFGKKLVQNAHLLRVNCAFSLIFALPCTHLNPFQQPAKLASGFSGV